MFNVRLTGWEFYNEKMPESEIRRAYFEWLDSIKHGITFKPTVPVSLIGTCVNHPDEERIARGEVEIVTSAIKTIESLNDENLMCKLGYDPKESVFVVETISESPTLYFIELSQAGRG